MRLRPHSKDESKALNPEPAPEKKPLVINYDADGVRIGDDGYPMTPTRTRMHRLFNFAFIWGIICALGCFGCIVASYFQGQEYHGFELVTSGGNMYNGYSVANLFRYEALVLLFTAIMGPVISIQGFRWFYDKRSVSFTAILMGVLAVVSLVYEIVIIEVVGAFDPVSLLTLVILALIVFNMLSVTKEHPTLKKAKIASAAVKK